MHSINDHVAYYSKVFVSERQEKNILKGSIQFELQYCFHKFYQFLKFPRQYWARKYIGQSEIEQKTYQQDQRKKNQWSAKPSVKSCGRKRWIKKVVRRRSHLSANSWECGQLKTGFQGKIRVQLSCIDSHHNCEEKFLLNFRSDVA